MLKGKDKEPLMVSIRCLAYNHEKSIRETLESFVMQKTNFRFEAIVHDDASTDGTAGIIREYAEKYPDIIKPIYETENQYSKHDGSLFSIMNKACTGKYIAYCEGDDYWIDPLKLQKQVDYLEAHPEVVYSCCRFNVLNEYTNTYTTCPNRYFDNELNKDKKEFLFDIEYPFTVEWVTLTLTQVIRRELLDEQFYKKFKYARDVHTIYRVLSAGKGVCHNFIGGVCRVSDASTFGKYSTQKRLQITRKVYEEFYDITRYDLIKTCLINTCASLINSHIYIVPHHLFEIKAYFIWLKKKIIRVYNYIKFRKAD